jgi:hypothetical protein
MILGGKPRLSSRGRLKGRHMTYSSKSLIISSIMTSRLRIGTGRELPMGI